MSKRSTNVVVNANDRLTLDGRHKRYFDNFMDGIVLESDDDGPSTVFALTWTDIADHLRTRRLVIQKGYYGTHAKTASGEIIPEGQIACFEKFGPLPFASPLLTQRPMPALEVRPMEVLEMEDCKMDIVRVGLNLGIWGRLHPHVQSRFQQVRFVWATAAMDACTRSLCALHLTVGAPDVGSVVAALAMAVREKGAENILHHGRIAWPQCGRPGGVHINGAMPYHSKAFVEAVLGLTGKHPIPSSKHPHLRGRVERMFRMLTSGSLGSRADVVSDNVLLADNYNPAKHSHLTQQELLHLLALLIVACYHNTPHRSLNGQTPLERWAELTQQGENVAPPPSKEEYRGVFGAKLRRAVGTKGISILGIDYHSTRLAGMREINHGVEVDVRVDECDISAISFHDPRDGCWHNAYSELGGLNDVTLSEWMETIRYITSRFGQADAHRQDIAAALNDFKERAGTL
ncbi:Mu transposase C-terminal domain-containing protein [Rhizobium ruizarguesonis]|uniref:Mu transposase C-terminal domain-containing protein n=1 Tax=Rhizobium ruizarguesonis TaxID=2081791 RepID=UPI0013EEB5AE|nr:Mu transposase C-terminal domain-containing protein [Rhizobium ruizarguesonis]